MLFCPNFREKHKKTFTCILTQKVGHAVDSGYDADKQLWFPKWRSFIIKSMSFQMISRIHNLAKFFFF